MTLRLAVGMFKHETNTFSPVPTRWEDFGPISGEAARRIYRHSGYAMSGLLEVADAMDATVTIPIAARALPSAPVSRDAFERISEILCTAALECDAMLLDLHGAMVAEECEDGEGEMLARIRHVRPGLPIGAALDSHGNITPRFVENCTVMPGYRTYPHLDMPETGRLAGRLLRDEPAYQVSGLAGRPGDDHAQWPVGPGSLGGSGARQRNGGQGEGRAAVEHGFVLGQCCVDGC